MNNMYFDRYGKQKYGEDIIPTHQKGYFAILLKDDKVLLTYPPQVDLPEFPGGSISRREDFRDCLYRKLYEETGIDFMLDYGMKEFSQTINYFADDAKPNGVYCIYEQMFIVYDASSYGFETNQNLWKTPENGKAEWVNVQDILSQKVKINYTHWLAVQNLFAGNK